MTFMTDSDPDTRASLIARICDLSDNVAWTEFVNIYQPVVERFLQRYSLQHADAAEISQEVLARVAKSIPNWHGDKQGSTFRGWLYRITRNLTIDFLRKSQLELTRTAGQQEDLSYVVDPNQSASAEFQAEYEKQLFHWACEKLKPQFKDVNWQAFWMSTVEGAPIEDVAQRLHIECSHVYVARSRIMARFAQLIQERIDETNQEPNKKAES
jgi:RNA polymerase sigma factor (sigma-70 family)